MFGQQDLQSEGDFDAKAALFRRGLESEKVIPEGCVCLALRGWIYTLLMTFMIYLVELCPN